MTFQVTRINEREFDSLRDDWNDLLGRSACDSVFLRWEWIHTWWSVFKRDRKLFILIARLDDRLVGIAPFYIEQAGLLRTRTLKVCSEELSPDYMDIIAEPGQEAEVVREIVSCLLQHAGEWDVISLDNWRAESTLLADPSLFTKYAHAAQLSQPCPYIKIESNYDEFCRSRRELLSYSYTKKWKKLREKENMTHCIVSDEESRAKGLRDLFVLHEKRADVKNMRSNFLSAGAQRFHQELSRYFLQERILNLQLLYRGETPISALYAFNYRNKVCVYQGGFDPAWSKYSVGMVMWDLGIQKAFADGFQEFDFLKGNEGYKSLWSNAVREEMLLTVFNKNLRGSFWRVMNDLKSALRKVKRVVRRPSTQGALPPA